MEPSRDPLSNIQPEALSVMDKAAARQLKCIPISLSPTGTLVVALENPTGAGLDNCSAVKFRVTDKRVKEITFVHARGEAIKAAIEKAYAPAGANGAADQPLGKGSLVPDSSIDLSAETV